MASAHRTFEPVSTVEYRSELHEHQAKADKPGTGNVAE